ncbi:MAG: phosphoglycerate dehydrogenase [Phycisphaerales bacterium]|nr:phosphoglycerate dehydrogenase [Phycisphaerales bacterium]
MTGNPRALLFESIHPSAEGILQAAGFAVERISGAPEGTALDAALAHATVVGIRSKTQMHAAHFQRHPHLMAVGCFCIGTNQVDLRAAESKGCAIFNSPFSNTRSVAEMTVAEAVCLFRKLFEKSAQLHAGRWDKTATNAHETRGRTLGIVGYGHIGSQVSVLAESLGMRVIFHDVVRKLPLGNAQSRPTLEALLREADCVSLHVPETPATIGMIGAKQIALMKPGAILINNARGTIVDVEALAAALRTGHLGGAALDVFPDEPAAAGDLFESQLRGCPSAILTPHIGGSTEEAQELIAAEVAEKLVHFWQHGSTETCVNLPEVDLPVLRAGQLRILHVHRNVPGVLGTMHTLLAKARININAEYLQSNPRTSYVILDVEGFEDPKLLDGIAAMPETIRMRTTAGSNAPSASDSRK